MECQWCEYARENDWYGKEFYDQFGATATHCRDCHETWTGAGQHCVRCHQTFSSESSGDKHEVYDRLTQEIYCLDPEDRGLEWDKKRRRWAKPADEGTKARFAALKAKSGQ